MAELLELRVARRAKPSHETLDLPRPEPELDERPEIRALSSVHRLRVPCRAPGFRHEAHELLVAERARMLAEFGPGLLERIAAPTEVREQLALQLREVVLGDRAVRVLPVHGETAIHPGERLVQLALRLEHDGDRETVLGRELALLAERDVGPHIPPPDVDRAQDFAPAAAQVHALAVTSVDSLEAVPVRRSVPRAATPPWSCPVTRFYFSADTGAGTAVEVRRPSRVEHRTPGDERAPTFRSDTAP